MKALSTKLLSPLVTDDHFKILSESPGFTASVLEWINDRYDVCEPQLVRDVFLVCEKLATRSEVIRLAFLDVGGVAFFDEFGIHNPSMRDQVDQVISVILQGRARERTSSPNNDPVVVPPKPSERFETPHATTSSKDEEILFDLGVRIKFGTSATSRASIEEVVCALMHSIGPNYPAQIFLDFPMIIEAICNQLKMTNSMNSLSNDSCEPLLSLLDHIIVRLRAEQAFIPLSIVSEIVCSLIESFDRRPMFVYRTAPLAIQLVSLTHEDSNWTVVQLESLVQTIAISVESVFEKPLVEKFEFKDSTVPVLLRRLPYPMNPTQFLIAQLAVDILSISTQCPDDIVGMCPQSIELVGRVSDWICDMNFYASSSNAAALATKASITVSDNSFTLARELIVSLKKLDAGEILTQSDFANIFAIDSRVPELVKPYDVVVRLLEQAEWELLTQAVANVGFADSLIDCVNSQLTIASPPPPKWVLETIALNQSSRPRLFVDAVLLLSEMNVPLFSPNTSDVSVRSNVLSLFSTNLADRKQAIVALRTTKSLTDIIGSLDSFVPTSSQNKSHMYKLKNAMSVSEEELSNAVKLALNPRLSFDIRTASITQACTLIVNSLNGICIVGFDIAELLSSIFENIEICENLVDLICLILDYGCMQAPTGSVLEELLARCVDQLFLSNQPVEILRICARLIFSRPNLGTHSDDVYWGLINQLNLIGDYCLLDLNRQVDKTLSGIITIPDKVFAFCVSLSEVTGNVGQFIESGHTPSAIEAALHANVPTDGLNRFILSIEALAETENFVFSILEPAVRIARLLPCGPEKDALVATIDRVTDSINLDKLCEYEVATLVVCRMMNSTMSNSSPPKWMNSLLTTDSPSVVNSVLRFFLVSPPSSFSAIESAVFRFPSQFSLLAWMYILSQSETIEMSSLERVSQLLDNDGFVGEMAWFLLVRFRTVFAVDDCRVWEKALDRMDKIPSACSYVADSIMTSLDRAQHVLDSLDLNPLKLEILSSLSKSELRVQLTKFLSESEFWHNITGDPEIVLNLILNCTRDNNKLFMYILHIGVIENVVLANVNQPTKSLIELIVRATAICENQQLNRFDSILEWIASDKFSQMILRAEKNDVCFELCRVAGIFVRDHYIRLPVWDSLDLVDSLMTEKNLLNENACSALIELARIGTRRTDVAHATKMILLDLMKFHDFVPVPDNLNSCPLFFNQVRLISVLSSVIPNMHEEYARWFSSIWQRSLTIIETKKSSNIFILTELVCGFIEIISRYPNSKSLSQPLSFILSYATRSGEISPSMFSLCLSAGEATAPLLIDKPVIGKIVHNLISLHATVHSRNIPKSIEAISRLGSVVRFVSGMIGCPFAGAQVMEILDGWVEAQTVIDPELLLRVIGAIVVTPSSSHLRTSLATTEKGKLMLSKIISGDKAIESLIIQVLQATSFKLNRELSGA